MRPSLIGSLRSSFSIPVWRLFRSLSAKEQADVMNTEESFSNSNYTDEMQVAERELSAFISAVTELLGPEQAELSTEDWLHESELIDSPAQSTSRDWRAVTIAASARLANRLTVALHRTRLVASTDSQEENTLVKLVSA